MFAPWRYSWICNKHIWRNNLYYIKVLLWAPYQIAIEVFKEFHKCLIAQTSLKISKESQKHQPRFLQPAQTHLRQESHCHHRPKLQKVPALVFLQNQNRFLRILLFRISPGSKLCMFLSGSRSSFRIVSKTLIKVKIIIWGSTKTFTFFQNCFQDLDCVFDYKPLSGQELKKQLLPSSFLSLRLLRPWELLLSLLSPNHNCYHKGAL